MGYGFRQVNHEGRQERRSSSRGLAACVLLWVVAAWPARAADVPLPTAERRSLAQMSLDLAQRHEVRRAWALDYARRFGLPVRQVLPDGRATELRGVQAGRLICAVTCNRASARTVAADDLWPGGALGLSLDGAGVVVGLWDAGRVRTTHNELAGRVTERQAGPGVADHATHVAGTLIAAGVSVGARGMCYAGGIDWYDWNNDLSEMATAGDNGLRISNHSYGPVMGWIYNYHGDGRWAWFGSEAVSAREDAEFGFYGEDAQVQDQIALNAPRYLVVRSAGNDRGEGPAPGTEHWVWTGSQWQLSAAARDVDGGATGFDTVASWATAKNALTVGAVYKLAAGYGSPADVVMTSFSAWGPTDDGRIKPDLVAPGVGVFSSVAAADNAYAWYSGTSMATPCVAGSLELLRQHYAATLGVEPRSATVKALAIHTAREAGAAAGPDYCFGWGLLNASEAAQTVSNASQNLCVIREATLTQGTPWTLDVTAVSAGALKATVVWTDPPGAPPPVSLDPANRMLVNDLDLRVTRNGATFFPWVLNPAAPSAPAVAGDNVLDNVEQVLIASAEAGDYRVTVSHKGGLLYGSQAFSVVITGAAVTGPEIQVSGNSRVIPDGDATPRVDDQTDFGKVLDDGGFVTHAFTIHNLGTHDLVLTGNPAVGIEGPAQADFQVTPAPLARIAARDSTFFAIRFNPNGLGARSATVRIPSNDADEPSYTFAIQGTGAVAYSFSCGPTYSLVSVPLADTGVTTAQQLCEAIPGCLGVWKWDAAAQGWVGHPNGGPNDFAVAGGSVVMAAVASASTVQLLGQWATPAYALRPGYNLLAVPLSKAGLASAELVAQDIPACTGVWRWNAVVQNWSGHPRGSGVNNFGVSAGDALLVYVTAAGNWP